MQHLTCSEWHHVKGLVNKCLSLHYCLVANRATRLCVSTWFSRPNTAEWKPPERRADEMKAEVKGQPDAQLAAAESKQNRTAWHHEPQRKPKVSSFQTGKQRGEAEALSPSNVHPPAHVRLRRLLRCPEETSNRPPFRSGVERVERCECSGQPARDARRILQLNKKLNMQLQYEHN